MTNSRARSRSTGPTLSIRTQLSSSKDSAHIRGAVQASASHRPAFAVLAVVAGAIALRAIQYAANRSLSLDEAALGLNIIHRSSGRLLGQLDFNQGAPPIFLLLQRAVEQAFGKDEYALRGAAFLVSVAAAALMVPFARRILRQPSEVLAALFVFALSGFLILYSATGKQYAIDVLATIVVYLVGLRVVDLRSLRWACLWAVVGAAAIWISFATVFVLAGLGTMLIVRAAFFQRWRSLALHAATGATWLASFIGLYFVSVIDLAHLESSIQSVSGRSGGGSSLFRTVAGAIRSDLGIGHLDIGGYDLGTAAAAVAIILMCVGLAALARDRPMIGALLAAPPVVTVIASELGKYPLFPRTLLFLTPTFCVCVAAGAFTLIDGSRLTRVTGIAALAAVVGFIAIPTAKHVAVPQETSDLKPALRFLTQHQRPNDAVWVYHASQYGLRYYVECQCFGTEDTVRRGLRLWPLRTAPGGPEQFAPALNSAPPRLIVSRSVGDSNEYQSELRALRGHDRVWILISDATADFRSTIFSFANGLGKQRDAPGHPDGLRLYDLSDTH
jgi:hypothetical protein